MEHHPAVSVLAYWRAGLWVIAMAMKLKPRTTRSRSMLLLSSLIFLDSTCFISISVSDTSYVSSCHILYFVVALRAASSDLDPFIDHLYKGKRRVASSLFYFFLSDYCSFYFSSQQLTLFLL